MIKNSKRKIFFWLFSGLVLIGLLPKTDILSNIVKRTSAAQTIGDLRIDWGVPAGKPIFYVTNFMPGNEEKRTVKITNNSLKARIIGVQGIKTNFPGFLAYVLEITISQNGTDIYGGSKGIKNLSQFFLDSLFLNSVKLLTFNPGETKTVTFKVKFKNNAGNSYQKTKVVFDLKIGYYLTELPGCGGINFCNQCNFIFPQRCFFTK